MGRAARIHARRLTGAIGACLVLALAAPEASAQLAAWILERAAAQHLGEGRYGEAEPLYRRAFEMREREQGPGHADVATTLTGLATVFERQDRYPEAETLYRRALGIREQALGSGHRLVGTALNNLAGAHRNQSRLEEAERLYARALTIFEDTQGPRHPDVAITRGNLALVELERGRYDRAGELSGTAEPGLLLTPPETGTADDDGYLSAGEVARLRLNADWVLLSACNTAAADGSPGAEGLSGLAKAFFHAGSRSLLVSHWPVASEATVALTTTMLREFEANPQRGKAEAHRRAMIALMNTPRHPEYALPFFWAPFVVVGEGGAR